MGVWSLCVIGFSGIHLVPAGSARTAWFLDSLHLVVGTSEMIGVYQLPEGALIQEIAVREVVKDLWGEDSLLVAAAGWEGYLVFVWQKERLEFLGKIPSQAFASRVVGMDSLVIVFERGAGLRAFYLTLHPLLAKEAFFLSYPDVRDMFQIGQFLLVVDAKLGIHVFDVFRMSPQPLFTVTPPCPLRQAGGNQQHLAVFCSDSLAYLLNIDFLARTVVGKPTSFRYPFASKVQKVRWARGILTLALGREGVDILSYDPDQKTLRRIRQIPTKSHVYDAMVQHGQIVIVEGGQGVRLLLLNP